MALVYSTNRPPAKPQPKYYGHYSYYKKLSKPEQLSRYKIIEPLIIACREAGYKQINQAIASQPQYREALKARSELFLSLNGLITRLALNRGVRVEELDDLFGYCTIFLDKALMRFDYSKNFAFTSFAFVYLKGAILNFIRQNNLIIKNVKDFSEGNLTYVFTGLELQPIEHDKDTINYILGTLNDNDARLLIWHYRLNESSGFKDTITTLLKDGIDCTEEAVSIVISKLQGEMANG